MAPEFTLGRLCARIRDCALAHSPHAAPRKRWKHHCRFNGLRRFDGEICKERYGSIPKRDRLTRDRQKFRAPMSGLGPSR